MFVPGLEEYYSDDCFGMDLFHSCDATVCREKGSCPGRYWFSHGSVVLLFVAVFAVGVGIALGT